MLAKPFIPTNPNYSEFWCSECDNNVVRHDKPETGQFFQSAYGHLLQENGLGEPGTIVFAICCDCLKRLK